MKSFYTVLICLVTGWTLLSQPKVTISDFENLNNSKWNGNLMYTNYSDGNKVTIRTALQITINGDKIIMDTQYPDEPNANSKESIRISKAGTHLGKEELVDKKFENGVLTLVTKFKGKDNNKKAVMYKTYSISEEVYSVEKEVQYVKTMVRILRNKYDYKRSE